MGGGGVGNFKQQQTILSQIFISLKSDWGGISVKFRWSPKQKKRSSLKLSRFFCPHLGELLKKRSSLKFSRFFYPNSGVYNIKFKSRSHQVLNEFSYQSQWGAIFSFWGQIGLKSAKNGYFSYSSGQWGGYSSLGHATAIAAHRLFNRAG